MNKVYIVANDYDDRYNICAVTFDPAKAQKLKKLFSNSFVEEWEVDALGDMLLQGYRRFTVYFKLNGDVSGVCDSTDEGVGEYIYANSQGRVIAYVIAKDKSSAIKIAEEKRALYLGEKEG